MSTARTLTEGFLAYLKDEGLDAQLPEIAELLSREADRRQVITVISAEAFEKKEQADLKAKLLEEWGEHPVTFVVDPSLLSGFLVAFGDRVIDMSGRNALNELSEMLK